MVEMYQLKHCQANSLSIDDSGSESARESERGKFERESSWESKRKTNTESVREPWNVSERESSSSYAVILGLILIDWFLGIVAWGCTHCISVEIEFWDLNFRNLKFVGINRADRWGYCCQRTSDLILHKEIAEKTLSTQCMIDKDAFRSSRIVFWDTVFWW